MAMGTVVSRGTGVLRVLVLTYVLGISPLADAFNLANTIPNMLYDIVIGGVVGATFIPVFIERLTNAKTEDEAWESISSVVTLAVIVLSAATVIFLAAAPWLINAFTAFDHAGLRKDPQSLAQQRHVATVLLRWFVPQLFFYGLLSIGGALLNVRRRFGAPMWVPIANNMVCIGVLIAFASVAPSPTLASVSVHPGQLLLLGAGTTAGVAIQFLLLSPSLMRAKLGRLRWNFNLHDRAVRSVMQLGSWTFGFVVANQIALFVIIALAFGTGGSGPVSSYTYAYAFMQMPYAVVAISVMNAVTPDLATHHSKKDIDAFINRFGKGLRSTLAIMIPASIALFLLAKPIIELLLGHGNANPDQARLTGVALAELSLGLVGFTVFQYVIRTLQSMRSVKVAFVLYVIENAITIALALLLMHPLGLAGITLSVSVAYSVAAIIGLAYLHSHLGHLGPPRCYGPLLRVLAASLAMGVVILVISNLSAGTGMLTLIERVFGSLIFGGLAYVGVISLIGRKRRTPLR
jgi:putative peptidoglycan lipid II flippase